MIEIKKNGDSLIWVACDNAPFNSEVMVSDGCQALIMRDGTVYFWMTGGKKTINVKRLFGGAEGGKWSVYGINTSRRVELLWGTSAVYADAGLNNAQITARCNGTVYAQIENGETLFRALADGGEITEEAMVDALRPTLKQAATTVLSSTCNELADFNAIRGAQTQIADKMKREARTKLENNFGLFIESSVVTGLNFDGVEKYLGQINKIAEERFNTQLAEEQSRQAKLAGEAINAFVSPKNNKEDK